MVIGYHVILGMYGFWLPNDPRGSWSTHVWAPHLRHFGPATKVLVRSSVAARPHDLRARLETKAALKYPAVRLSGAQVQATAGGFGSLVEKMRLTVYACSIMPDHVHLVLGRRHRDVEKIAELLKRAATRQWNRRALNPMSAYKRANNRTPSPWAEHGWYVFINTPQRLRETIEYVELNPVKAGLPQQHWPFIVPYAG